MTKQQMGVVIAGTLLVLLLLGLLLYAVISGRAQSKRGEVIKSQVQVERKVALLRDLIDSSDRCSNGVIVSRKECELMAEKILSYPLEDLGINLPEEATIQIRKDQEYAIKLYAFAFILQGYEYGKVKAKRDLRLD